MIRKMKNEEISKVYPYVHEIFSAMEIPALDELGEELLEDIVMDAMYQENYRYGSNNAWVCERKGQIVGAFFAYPSEWEKLIDGPLQTAMLKNGRAVDTMIQENESMPGEWYLDTLVTNPEFRRQGIAKEMLTAASQIAKKTGYDKISLNCDIENFPAYHLYRKMGYVEETQLVLSDHIYWHMVKEL